MQTRAGTVTKVSRPFLGVGAVVLCAAVAACQPAPPAPSPTTSSVQSGSPAPSPPDSTVTAPTGEVTAAAAPGAKTAAAALGLLPVKGRAPMTGYSRSQFGQAWADVDRNGCDTRNDILARDLQNVTFKPGTHNCVVLTGDYVEPYTGRHVFFARSQNGPPAVEIDHVVALGNAWQTGAQQMDPDTRLRYANDPLVLLAVDGPANQQKGDGDAATWLPANKGFRCSYVARQIAIKAKYHLWVTSPEREAMVRVLSPCPDQRLPD